VSVEHCPKEVADDIVRKTMRIQFVIAVGSMLDSLERRRGMVVSAARMARDICQVVTSGYRVGRMLGLGRTDAASAVMTELRNFPAQHEEWTR